MHSKGLCTFLVCLVMSPSADVPVIRHAAVLSIHFKLEILTLEVDCISILSSLTAAQLLLLYLLNIHVCWMKVLMGGQLPRSFCPRNVLFMCSTMWPGTFIEAAATVAALNVGHGEPILSAHTVCCRA